MAKKRIWFRPKKKLDFPCYRYRWHLFIYDKYLKREVILASAPKLRDIKDYVLREFSNWDCLYVEVFLRPYALCKKKGTGEVLKIPYDIFCEEEEENDK